MSTSCENKYNRGRDCLFFEVATVVACVSYPLSPIGVIAMTLVVLPPSRNGLSFGLGTAKKSLRRVQIACGLVCPAILNLDTRVHSFEHYTHFGDHLD